MGAARQATNWLKRLILVRLINRMIGWLYKISNVLEQRAYHRWLERIASVLDESHQRIRNMETRPFFSFILPVYNTNRAYLATMLKALLAQTYPDFEICISDDGSTDPWIKRYLEKLAAQHCQIRLDLGSANKGIAANTNRALALATGDYIVFCDHDDHVEPFALEAITAYINAHPDADLLYSDEDLMDENGRRHSPRLQPDWNPDMFTSHMYFMHLICCRKTMVDKVGPMRSGFDGAQDYDFFLRFTEQAQQIVHIPMVLYSWRLASDSLASNPMSKIYAYSSGLKALEHAVRRRGEDATVVRGAGAGLGVYRLKRRVHDPSVSHIIAESSSEMVVDAVKSICAVAAVPVEIIVVVSDSDTEIRRRLEKDGDVIVVTVADQSNRAHRYNCGARRASHSTLVFSPDTVEVLDSDYPLAILEHTQRLDIGAVGTQLTYPDGKFYHTGMLLGVNGVAGYAYRNVCQGPGHWRFAAVIRNFSAVSWDLMGVSTSSFESVGGFDEQLSAYADVDFCLKLLRKGRRNLYTPYVSGVLKNRIHRLVDLRYPEAETEMMTRYKEWIMNDPCYHPLCTRHTEDFRLDVDLQYNTPALKGMFPGQMR